MTTAPARRMDSYPIDQINEEKINKIIIELNPEKAFSFWLKTFVNEKGESIENFSDVTLASAIEETFKRLCYELYHRLRQTGEPINMPSLLLLFSHLQDVYDEQITKAPKFTEIIDWDSQLAFLLEILCHFHSPSKDLVGVQYIEVEAIDSSALKESDQQAQVRITGIIDAIRLRFFQATVDSNRQELFEEISMGMARHFIELKNTFADPEKLILSLLDDVIEFMEEEYEEVQDILEDQQNLRKIIPEKFAHFSKLLESNSQAIVKAIKHAFEIKAQPNLQSLWDVIITIAFNSLDSTEEEEVPEEEPGTPFSVN